MPGRAFFEIPNVVTGLFSRLLTWGGIVATLAALTALFTDWVNSVICLLVVVAFAYTRAKD